MREFLRNRYSWGSAATPRKNSSPLPTPYVLGTKTCPAIALTVGVKWREAVALDGQE